MNEIILWFLSLFPQFRDLAAAAQAQARAAESYNAVIEQQAEKQKALASMHEQLEHEHSELLVQKESLETDLAALNTDLENLQEAHDELATEKLLLQDRLESAIADKEKLWDMVEEALGSERNALRTMVNHAVQKASGGIPFPEAHHLPTEAAARPQKPGAIGRAGRMLQSQAVMQRNQAFVREYVESLGPHEPS